MTKRIAWALVLVLATAATAFAQQKPIAGDGFLAPPVEGSIDWLTILYFVVAGVGMAVVAFKGSGRTHLD